MFSINKEVKDVKRLRHIIAILFSQGFGYYLKEIKVHKHLPFGKRILPVQKKEDLCLQAQALRQSFELLGPTFVKFGQLLSLRPDILPEEFLSELSRLQDRVPGFSYAEVERIVQEDLGQPISILFDSFDAVPLSAASVAQVHKAKLKNGKIAAVKVQRPHIQETMDADLDILLYLAKALQEHIQEFRHLQLVDVVHEFSQWTHRELNFRMEADSMQRMKRCLHTSSTSTVTVPAVYPELCSQRIVTMEYIDGFKIDDTKHLAMAHVSQPKIAQTYFNSILEQALLFGFFHADPHPANIYVQKKGAKVRLVFLDFGIVGELNADDRRKIIAFLRSIPQRNAQHSLDILLSLAKEIRNEDLAKFREKAHTIMSEVYGSTLEHQSAAKGLYQLLKLGAQHGIVFDPNHILMAKAVYQGEGLALKLDPTFKVADGLQEFTAKYLRRTLSPKNVALQVRQVLHEEGELLYDLPQLPVRIRNIMRRLEGPQVSVQQLHELEHEIDDSSARRTLLLFIVLLAGFAALLLQAAYDVILWPAFTIFILLFVFYSILSRKPCEVKQWKNP